MDKEIERIVEALTKGEPIADFVPKSRSEAYLKSALMKQNIDDLPTPQSRMDVLLCMLNSQIHKVYDEHHADGVQEGIDIGRDVGYQQGYKQGNTDGYETGHTEGYSSGYEVGNAEGIEAGKQAEKKAFWDVFFNYGNRKEWRSAFGACFDKTLLNELKDVPYAITPVRGYANASPEFGIFYYTNRDNASWPIDISHIKFDFSKIGFNWNLAGVFRDASVDNIILDLTPIKKVSQLFVYPDSSTKPTKITLTVTENLTSYSNPFYYLDNSKGVNIQFTEGSVIAASISFSYTTYLVVESAISTITALKNYAGTDQELVNTLTFPTAVWDRLEASGITPPSGSTWKEHVNNKGWSYA